MQLSKALEIMRSPKHAKYREACHVVVANLDQLISPVFVVLPEGWSTEWAEVIDHSAPLCGCRRRRLLMPPQLTMSVTPHSHGEVTLAEEGQSVVVLPRAGDGDSAYNRFTLIGDGLQVENMPFTLAAIADSPFVVTLPAPPFPLKPLQEELERGTDLSFAIALGSGRQLAIGKITRVVASEPSVSFVFDEGVDVVEGGKSSRHRC